MVLFQHHVFKQAASSKFSEVGRLYGQVHFCFDKSTIVAQAFEDGMKDVIDRNG